MSDGGSEGDCWIHWEIERWVMQERRRRFLTPRRFLSWSHLLGKEDPKVQIKGVRFARGRGTSEVGWVALHYAVADGASLTMTTPFGILERTFFFFFF